MTDEELFMKRIETEREFCLELFHGATIKLLAAKYAYYVCNAGYWKDVTYDIAEKSWYMMGRCLRLLTEDETSPCVDFDYNNPLAREAIELAKELM